MSILTKEDLASLRESQGIVPDEEDDTVQIWRRAPDFIGGQTEGTSSGMGVDLRGFPATTSEVVDSDPQNDTPGYELLYTLFGRVESASRGREMAFGGQNTSVAPWDIVLPAIDENGDEITIETGDQLRVLLPGEMQPGAWQIYEAVGADDGETYGVLLTVNCQRIEN